MAENSERRATVFCLAVSGKGNKMFKKGDIVTPAHFPEGAFDEKIKSGHLKEANPQEKPLSIEDAKAAAKIQHAEAEAKNREVAVKEAAEVGVEITADMNSDAINALVSKKKIELASQAEAEAKLKEAKLACDNYGIDYDADATIETLTGLILEHEAKNTKSFVNGKGETVVVKSIDDIGIDELKAELTKAQASFDKKAKKPALYSQWLGLE